MYTINCHALEFKPTKSQKKILRKFNQYLVTGELKGPGKYDRQQGKMRKNLFIVYGKMEY